MRFWSLQLASQGRQVTPIYVRFGLAWEDVEVRHLERFLASLPFPDIRALVVLDLPVADIYGTHWSVTGRGVPDDDSPDEAVYLPGRNLLLLAKSSVWCALNGIPTVALGTLAANPFPDADREFFAGFSALAGRALGCPLEVVTPFAGLAKHEVLEVGRQFQLELTFSCIRRARTAIADSATSAPNVNSPSKCSASPTPPSTRRHEPCRSTVHRPRFVRVGRSGRFPSSGAGGGDRRQTFRHRNLADDPLAEPGRSGRTHRRPRRDGARG